MRYDIGIELGGAHVRAATRARGVAASAPSLTASRGGEILYSGEDARSLLGREPRGVTLSRPVRGGRVSDADAARFWVGRLIGEFAGKLKKGAVAFAVPPELPEADRRILRDAALGAGATACGFLRSDLASLLGSGRDAAAPKGILLIELGAGRTGASVMSYGRAASFRSLSYGMGRADEELAALLRESIGLSVGPATAEELKRQLGSATPGRKLYVKAAGLSGATGFPVEVEVDAERVEGATIPIAEAAAELAVRAMRAAGDAFAEDLLEAGAILTGGGARLFGLERRIANRAGIRAATAEDPANATIRGLHRAIAEDRWEEFIEAAGEA